MKMDFLGLRTLTVIQNAVRLAKQSQGADIDIDHIDFNDKQVPDSIGTGKTEGVFQLESGGMKSFMKELKPENLEDIIAGISPVPAGAHGLYSPIPERGKMTEAPSPMSAPSWSLFCAPPYGCIVYQEQVMQICAGSGGVHHGRSDLVRRAMSKKKAAVMEKERQNFGLRESRGGGEGLHCQRH